MKLLSEDCIQIKNDMFFFAKNCNIFFSLNICNGQIRLLDSVKEEHISEERLFSKILQWNKNLIFIPMNAKKIWILDKETFIWKSIRLEEYEEYNSKFYQGYIKNEYLYMIGCSVPAIVKVNLNTYEYKSILFPLREKREYYFRSDYIEVDNKLLLASYFDNSIMYFDLVDETIEFKEIGHENNMYSGICYDGQNYWLSPRYNTAIIKWDGYDNTIEYNYIAENKKKCAYNGIFYYKKNVCLLARMGSTYIINSIDGSYIEKNCNYIFAKKINGNLVVLDSNGELTVESGNQTKKYELNYDLEAIKQFLKENNNYVNSKILKETNVFDLEMYLHNIK